MHAMTAMPDYSMSNQPGARWHVGFSINLSDARLIRTLGKAHYETYYPMVRELRAMPKRRLTLRHRGNPIAGRRAVLVPLWPRYIFIRFDPLHYEFGRRELFEFAGLQGLLCDEDHGGHRLAPVDDALVERWRGKEINGAIPGHATAKDLIIFKVGETVRINHGPFAGFNGEVTKLPNVPIEELDETARVNILVAMFGGRTPVELELGDIEKL